MTKIINGFFSILKFLLLIVSFVVTFYIIMTMYQRLGKSYVEALSIFIPYFLLLLIFFLNYVLKQKQVTGNLFYNLTCCLVFGVLIFVGYRTVFDDFMLIQNQSNYHMSFQFFSDMIAPLKSMLYLLFVGNICLMFTRVKRKRVIVREVSSESATE